jgi:hypothetical protein
MWADYEKGAWFEPRGEAPKGVVGRNGTGQPCGHSLRESRTFPTLGLMTHRFSIVLSLLALALVACSGQDRSINDKIKLQVGASTSSPLDLALVGPQGWERVCIFGPYSTNDIVQADLGFKWDSDSQSAISVNDGINLIVFTRGKEVIAFAEHRRRDGDFESDKAPCTTPAKAKLTRSARSDGIPLFTMPQ